MRIALWALLVVPGLLAAAMLAAAVSAGDWLNDSPLLMVGLPALLSALITFVGLRRRGKRGAAAAWWSVASAISAVLLFGVLFVAGVAIDCAGRTRTTCS